ncbi:AimR family lysis-lysogeny pheromone receptor [Bacillus sp. FSL K6-0268]|uniref:AimR family lysis-lysogeny pheromone receptor n=1 Tax=Bacillus TaxID=1386 RepID=UPI001F55D187
MKDIRIFLKKILENSLYTQNGLAKEINASSSVFTDFFTHNKEISMYTVYKFTQILINEQKENIELYCSNVFFDYKKNINCNLKLLFVISYINGYKQMQKTLITIASTHHEPHIRHYANLFKLFKKRADQQCNKKILKELEKVRANISTKEQVEMGILCDILYLLAAGDIGDFGMLQVYVERVKENIEQLRGKEIYSIYIMWIDDIWGYLLLRNFDVKGFTESHKQLHENKELKFFPVVSAMMDVRKGEESMFRNYEESRRYLSNGLQVLREYKCELKYRIALNNLNFLKLIHNRDLDTICIEDLHPAELALYWILKGKMKKAIRILKKLLEEQGELSAIQTCYLGQATNNLNLLARANEMCIEKKDYFFLQYTKKVYEEYKNKQCLGGVL